MSYKWWNIFHEFYCDEIILLPRNNKMKICTVFIILIWKVNLIFLSLTIPLAEWDTETSWVFELKLNKSWSRAYGNKLILEILLIKFSITIHQFIMDFYGLISFWSSRYQFVAVHPGCTFPGHALNYLAWERVYAASVHI